MRDGDDPSFDALMRIAAAHLARFSTSTARLRQVLARRVQRGRAREGREPLERAALDASIDPVIERLRLQGLVDDAAFAQARAKTLARRGRPAWRIRTDLAGGFGIDPAETGLSETLAALDPAAQARRWAERRRLGPFRPGDRAARRDRDIASLARAGFPVEVARAVIDGDGSPQD